MTPLSTRVSSFDIVGDIAVVRLPEHRELQCRVVAEDIMRRHNNLRTVLKQTSPVLGEHRLRKLELVVGENRTETIHREHGCVFKVDLEKCYFSPRLSFERMRVARLTRPGENIVNMFAGVGGFSVLMAKYGGARKVYSIDVNPHAIKYMRENVRLNRLGGQVIPVLGDAKVILTSLQGIADRVLMPLPDKAYEYLNYAVLALKNGKGWIHYYDFVHSAKERNPVEEVERKVAEKLKKSGSRFVFQLGRVVRTTGPNWHQVVLDIHIGTEA